MTSALSEIEQWRRERDSNSRSQLPRISAEFQTQSDPSNSGLLAPHNRRWTPQTFLRRFYARIDKSGGVDACHPWTGHKDRDGYGEIRPRDGAKRPAIRATHILLMVERGESVPDGFEALHSCDNPPCMNERNMADCIAKGRHVSQRTAVSR